MNSKWLKVYLFTLRTSGFTRRYMATTLIVAALLIGLICGGMLLTDSLGSGGGEDMPVSRAVVVGADDLDAVSVFGGQYGNVIYETAPDTETAAAVCLGVEDAVIVLVGDGEITVLTPPDSAVSVDTAAEFAAWLASAYTSAQQAASGADARMPVQEDSDPNDPADTDMEMISQIIELVVPYVAVMLMYFMVLIYGQGVANSAIMEKTSRLMDLFLVSVSPSALITGKVLAMATAGLAQVIVWIASVIGGCGIGSWLVRTLNPDTTLSVIAVFESAAGIAAMFDPAALLAVALVLIGGFLVYCALAGIGGALASKPEELSSSNYIFTLALVISFFICLFSGESFGVVASDKWMAYVPFTAVMVMPGRLLTGAATPVEGLVSAAVSGVCAVALMGFAGKVYAATAFYRGKTASPVKMLRQLFSGNKL